MGKMVKDFRTNPSVLPPGFECIESSSDTVRTVYFRLPLLDMKSKIFTLVFQYELTISDDPFVSTDENFQYDFEKSYIEVRQRLVEYESIFEDDYNTNQIPIHLTNIDDIRKVVQAGKKIHKLWGIIASYY